MSSYLLRSRSVNAEPTAETPTLQELLAEIKALREENEKLKRVSSSIASSEPSSASIAVTADDVPTKTSPSKSLNFEKIKDPKPFSGDRSQAHFFLYRLQEYVQNHGPDRFSSEHETVSWASTLLEGSAGVWWYNLVIRNCVPTTFTEFTTAFAKQFAPSTAAHRDECLKRLESLKQHKTCRRYADQFMEILPSTAKSKYVNTGEEEKICFNELKASSAAADQLKGTPLRVSRVIGVTIPEYPRMKRR